MAVHSMDRTLAGITIEQLKNHSEDDLERKKFWVEETNKVMDHFQWQPDEQAEKAAQEKELEQRMENFMYIREKIGKMLYPEDEEAKSQPSSNLLTRFINWLKVA